MPTTETTTTPTDTRVSLKAPATAAAIQTPPYNIDKDLFSASRLAPEIVLIILSFLDYHDDPSRLQSILTLCKPWARLALELIYEQPVLTLKSIPSFITTLGLQDRLFNGQTPFWETNINRDGRKSLGIDYRSLIKKPCRILGAVAPSKQDLVQLWDLQALLWTVPALAATASTPPQQVLGSSSSPSSSPPQSPLSPPPSPSLLVQSSSSSSLEAPEPAAAAQSPSPPRRSSSSSPSPSKAILLRRKKKTLPPPGPVVMMLESSAAFSEIMHEVLREVPGMKLRQLHYRLIPGLPLSDLLKNHLSTLQELIISRSPTRLDEFMTIAQLLSGNTTASNNNTGSSSDGDNDSNNNRGNTSSNQRQQQQQAKIHTLALDRCQGAGVTVLTELVRACGSHLRTLEFRQHTAIRPVGDLAVFPPDASGEWDAQEISQGNIEREIAESPSSSTCEPGQACRQCGTLSEATAINIIDTNNNGKAQEAAVDELEVTIDGLSIVDSTVALTIDGAAATSTGTALLATPEQQQQQQQQTQQEQAGVPVGTDPESRMDLAMHEVSDLCPRLMRLRLQNMTWLSDKSLSGFRPYSLREKSALLQQQRKHRSLKEIELLDSHYGSQLTIEGLLELCGADLEILVVDRKSCWKTRVSQRNGGDSTSLPSGLCGGCIDQERVRRSRLENMSTGDRIISGLLSKTTTTRMIRKTEALPTLDSCLDQVKEEVVVVSRLCNLVLIDHYVSVQVFKEALRQWNRTLAVVSLRLYKCSNQALEDALVPIIADEATTHTTALQRIELSLPWITPSETEQQLAGMVDRVFEAHASLGFVEINRRVWRRKGVVSPPA
ncbi:hypothetical protein BGX29_011126 [Mortierella sp. GBA35]|nr:hypothetical protein BGX29_011126 [Mortierella sp. GBA35]